MNDQMDIDPPVARRAPRAVPKKKGKNRRVTAAAPQPREEAHAEPMVRRSAPRPVPPRAEAAREPARETPRDGAVVALSRDGQRLTRRRIASGDPLDVPANEIPQGWDYQWNPVAVLNKGINEILQGDLNMYANGWRPVPASRHAGRWTPVGYEGDIVVKDLRLEERPMSLSEEARAEDVRHAKAQVRDRTDALRLTQKELPGANVARARGNAGGLKMDIDFGKDIPRPEHEIDDEV